MEGGRDPDRRRGSWAPAERSARYPPLSMLPLLAALSLAADVDARRDTPAGSARMVGLGGAYRAVAEGAMAQSVNPAAIAVRPQGTAPDRWAGDGLVVAGGVLPVIRAFDAEGLVTEPLPTLDLQAGGVLGREGYAGAITLGLRTLNDPESARRSTITEAAAGWGVAAADGRWHAGMFVGMMSVRTVRRGVEGPELTATLPTAAAGVRYDLPDSPLLVGLAGKAPWRARSGSAQVEAVSLPWEAGAGVAARWGDRSAGPRTDAPAERRPFVLVAFDVATIGPQRDTTPLSAWTRARPTPTSTGVTVALAAGVEVEAVPYRLRVRGGAYTEPARLRLGGPRVHGALGADLALFELPRGALRWTLLPTLDVSVRGIRPAVALGVW
jgi:hypothetical protein